MNYFVDLPESGQMVNIAQITSVTWNTVPEGAEAGEGDSTIAMSNGCFIIITRNDAKKLWEALNRYNNRFVQALSALPLVVQALVNLDTSNEVAAPPAASSTSPNYSARYSNVGDVGPIGVGTGTSINPGQPPVSSGEMAGGSRAGKGRVYHTQAQGVAAAHSSNR